MEQIILPIHLLTLAFIAFNVFQADHLGFNWMSGKVNTLDEKVVMKYHIRTWIGLMGMIVSGLFLFWPIREYLLTRPQFFIKMAFVIMLFCNSFVIGFLQKTATTKSFKSLTFKEKLPLIISGAISTTSWIGATIFAFFLEQD